MLRAAVLLLAFTAACGAPIAPCKSTFCLPPVRLEVTKVDGSKVNQFSGSAVMGEGKFVFGCGGATAPTLAGASLATCDGNAAVLADAIGGGDLQVEVSSPDGSFNGLVVAVENAPPVDSSGCQIACGTRNGAITVR